MSGRCDLYGEAGCTREDHLHSGYADGEPITPTPPRPTLADQEALANLLRIGRPGNVARQTANRLVQFGWATYSVRDGKWTLTDLGEAALRGAASR